MKIRTIETRYFEKKNTVQKTRAVYPNNAILHCVMHMQLNSYGADVAEVHDLTTGELHAQVVRSKSNEIRIIYERDPLDYQQAIRRTASALFEGLEELQD